jgi:hypothetical protein
MVEEWHDEWVVVEDVVQSSIDKCHLVGELNGATWPSHGLPHGTPALLRCCKKKLDSIGVEPVTYGHGKRLGRARLPDHPQWYLLSKVQIKYLNLPGSLGRGRKGWGLAPSRGIVTSIHPQT